MNNQRRKTITEISSKLENISIDIDALDDIKAQIETVLEEETEYHDNMPENLQTSEKGERAYEVIELLQSSIDELDALIEAVGTISEVTANLEEGAAQ